MQIDCFIAPMLELFKLLAFFSFKKRQSEFQQREHGNQKNT